MYHAWQVRNLSTEFQESESLFRIVVIIFVLLFIGIPVVLLGTESPDARLFIISAVVSVGTSAILILLYQPKYFYEKNQSSKGTVTVTGLEFANTESRNSSFDGDYVISNQNRRDLAAEVRMLRKRVKEFESKMEPTVTESGSS